MKKILLWDPRQPAANPTRLEIDDAIASAAARAGVAAADPADAGPLAVGAPVDPANPTEVIIWSGITRISRRVFVPLAVAALAVQAGAAVLPGGAMLGSGTPTPTPTGFQLAPGFILIDWGDSARGRI
jgi:hypothetical protein